MPTKRTGTTAAAKKAAPVRSRTSVYVARPVRPRRDPHVPMAAQPMRWSHRELAVVLGIVGFLALAIILAVDPVRRLGEARDAVRLADVRAVANAIVRAQTEVGGPFVGRESAPIMYQPAGSVQVIVADDGGINCGDTKTRPTCGNFQVANGYGKSCVANISGLVPRYLAEVPVAPALNDGSAYGAKGTGYYVARRFGGVLEVGACDGEAGGSVAVEIGK